MYLASVKPLGEILEVEMEAEEVREVKGKGKGKGKAKEEVKAARLLLPSDEISLYLNESASKSSNEICVLVQIPPLPEGTLCCAGCHGLRVDAPIESQRLPSGKWQM